MKMTTCKGSYSGDAADCLDWLEEMQPSLVSVEIAGKSQSLDITQAWPQALRAALVDLSDDIDGGEAEWQQYLTDDALADVIERADVEASRG